MWPLYNEIYYEMFHNNTCFTEPLLTVFRALTIAVSSSVQIRFFAVAIEGISSLIIFQKYSCDDSSFFIVNQKSQTHCRHWVIR